MAKLTVTRRVGNLAMKVINDCNVNDEVRRPGNVQTLDLQVPASLATTGWNVAAAVGTIARVVCNVSNGR